MTTTYKLKTWSVVIIFVIAGFFSFSPQKLDAQETRKYHYPSIDFSVAIQKDSSVQITEKETFTFEGEYHQGWRSLSLDKLSAINDISVREEDGTPLTYSKRRLDKTSPSSWGKYTVYKENNAQNIEWYYNMRDTTHSWVLSYTVHGGIGFFDTHDEFYYNLFTRLDAYAEKITATVTLPSSVPDIAAMQRAAYRSYPTAENISHSIIDNKTFVFSMTDVLAGEDTTIAPGWPKGIVSKSAYWKEFFRYELDIVLMFLSLALFLGSIIWRLYFYYTREVLPKKRLGTIIPEYEPPQNLRPAMAELIVRESITPRAWAATVVDLAVRGYIKISEETPTGFRGFFKKNPHLASGVFVIIGAIMGGIFSGLGPIFIIGIVLFLYFLPLILRTVGKGIGGVNPFASKKFYKIERTEKSNDGLEDYEVAFLAALFKSSSDNTFSMLNREPLADQLLYQDIQQVKTLLYAETERDTVAYEVPLTRSVNASLFAGIAFMFALLFGRIIMEGFSAMIGMAIVWTLFGVAIIYSGRTNPRLNTKGNILRKDWLGFKMYLETAEKYRMQNLTPDIFEKYLPYAIIFKVEKKWAHAFEGVSLPSPAWYHGAAYVSGGSFASSGASSFSATGFTSSFSTSFVSSFSSSGGGGGGGSGGGGGAGGGGGGGGGGAS